MNRYPVHTVDGFVPETQNVKLRIVSEIDERDVGRGLGCGVWGVVCDVCCVGRGVWDVRREVWGEACGVWHLWGGVWGVGCGVWGAVCGVWCNHRRSLGLVAVALSIPTTGVPRSQETAGLAAHVRQPWRWNELGL